MAKNTAPKTNAARLLDKAHINYDLVTYEVDPDNLDARHVADSLGEDIESVFKTLVLHADGKKFFVCVVPGNREVDLKKAAKAFGVKKIEMLHVKELLPLTGYIRGGCSPIGMKKSFPTIIHSTAENFEKIYISAGVRGMQICINPQELIDFCKAGVADLVKEEVEL